MYTKFAQNVLKIYTKMCTNMIIRTRHKLWSKETAFVQFPLLCSFQIPLAIEEGLGISEALLLQTLLGVASSIGAISFGFLILSKSQQCMISRQYLLQASIFGIGNFLLFCEWHSHEPYST